MSACWRHMRPISSADSNSGFRTPSIQPFDCAGRPSARTLSALLVHVQELVSIVPFAGTSSQEE